MCIRDRFYTVSMTTHGSGDPLISDPAASHWPFPVSYPPEARRSPLDGCYQPRLTALSGCSPAAFRIYKKFTEMLSTFSFERCVLKRRNKQGSSSRGKSSYSIFKRLKDNWVTGGTPFSFHERFTAVPASTGGQMPVLFDHKVSVVLWLVSKLA